MSPLTRLWNLVRRRRLDEDLRQEMETHLALIEDEGRVRGLNALQARQNARTRFGGPLVYREQAFDAVTLTWLVDAWKDVTLAARRLMRSPTFSVAALLTLALAIGANAAIFAVVRRVLLNPLPYPESDRLIELDHGAQGLRMASGIAMSPGLFFHYQDRARTLLGTAIYQTDEQTLTGEAQPERVRVSHVTTNLASVLRVWPAQGRWFSDAEGLPGARPVAVLSHGLWVRRYGADPNIVGRPLTLNGVPADVIGVMPASFAFPDARVEVLVPELLTRAMGFGTFNHYSVARLRDRLTLADARAELNSLIADLPRVYPSYPLTIGYNLQLTSTAISLKEAKIGAVARTLWILLASVGSVLLIACANVATLFLVRADARQREVAVRHALGAGDAGIARCFLAESTVLCLAGGLLGLLCARVAVRALVAFGPANLPRLEEIRLDGTVLMLTVVVSLVSALAFGAIPLWRRGRLAASLHESGRSHTTSRSRQRVRQVLVASQIALALVLVVSAGLLGRSFQKLRAIDPGFNPTRALTFRLGLPDREYSTRRSVVATHHAILERLAALPGVTATSASTCLPLAEEGWCYGSPLRVHGRPLPKNELPPTVAFRAVAGGYVEAMGMRLLRGHGIDRSAVERSEPIAVINQALADAYFAHEEPLGTHVSIGLDTWLTIVGIVANTPFRALGEATGTPMLYMPMSVAGGPDMPASVLAGPDVGVMSYMVRSAISPRVLLPAARRVIDSVDAKLAMAQVRTLEDILDRASAQLAFTMALIAMAASLALLLGAIGMYGAMSYVVSQRTREIGVRLALGADSARVAYMVLRQGSVVAIAGMVVGLGVALAGSRVLESLLHGVSSRDPGVFMATTLALLGVALLASWLPARRASRVDPLIALRSE